MTEKRFADNALFHGTNKAGWEQHEKESRYGKFWTNNPSEAFMHALSNAKKFKSEPLIAVHLDPDGTKFEDITTGSGEYSRTFESRTRFDETGNELEIFDIETLDSFFVKYIPHDIERARAHLQYYLQQLESKSKN